MDWQNSLFAETFFLHVLLLLFKGDFVEEGSYFYDVKDTIEWK